MRTITVATMPREFIATLTDGLSNEDLAVTCRTMKAMQADVNARIDV